MRTTIGSIMAKPRQKVAFSSDQGYCPRPEQSQGNYRKFTGSAQAAMMNVDSSRSARGRQRRNVDGTL